MGFDASHGFGMAYVGFGRMQLSIAYAMGLTETQFRARDFSTIDSDDEILHLLKVDGFWVLDKGLCESVAKRIEEIVLKMPLIEDCLDYRWDAKDLVRALRETANDETDKEFIMW